MRSALFASVSIRLMSKRSRLHGIYLLARFSSWAMSPRYEGTSTNYTDMDIITFAMIFVFLNAMCLEKSMLLDDTLFLTLILTKLSDFLLDLHQSLAHQGLAKSLDISIGMPALFANLAASTSRHISSQKIAQLSLKKILTITDTLGLSDNRIRS